MEGKLLEALEEMEGVSFNSLDEVLKQYDKKEILDIWLKYEGINGYTSSIINVINKLYSLDI